MSTSFNRLQIEGWRQFDSVGIDIHPRLTVITGSNGSGKSTLLNVFAAHFGFSRALLATPSKSNSGNYEYAAGLFKSLLNRFSRHRENLNNIGYLRYTNDVQSELMIHVGNSAQYNIQQIQQQHVVGLHVDSHRPSPRYQGVAQIQTTGLGAESAYNNYNSELNNYYQGGYSTAPPIFRMKEALVNMALFGEGNKYIEKNEVLKECFVGFARVLRNVLPPDIGFLDLTIRSYEVVMVTKSGEFMIDAASGGVMALIDLAWRIHLFSQNQQNFVVTMDEPENHLHPSMQRTLMRSFMDAFPKAQFIIATHSPFIVSSVKDSYVYVLRYQDASTKSKDTVETVFSRRIYSQRLDNINKAGSASDILMEVLGVPATIPEWVEDSIKRIVIEFKDRPIDTHTLSDLRSRLAALGFGEMYPSALAALTRNQ